MDRFQHSVPSLDELRQIQDEARASSSLRDLRGYFERVQELRRIHSGNFDVQLLVADAQEEIILRARDLRAKTGGDWDDEPLGPPARTPAVPEAKGPSPEAAEIPPDLPRVDQKSWRQATFLAFFLTAVICVAFFYLIQTARKINLEPPAPPKTEAPGKAIVQNTAANPAGVPLTPTLRLYSDLVPGTVSIDDGEPQNLKDGELNLDHLEPGRHSIKLAGRSGAAEFSFDVGGNSAPQVVGLPTASNAMAVLVSSQDGKARVTTNLQQSQLSVDGKPAGDLGPDGLALDNIGTTDHELLVSQAKDRQRFVWTYTPAPVLTVYVKSDLNLGIVVLKAGQDGVSIFINDKPYRRKTDQGQLRIPLKVGHYFIRLHKDGFTDPPPQEIDVKKSEEAELSFTLTPEPNMASLQITGAAPGTLVYLDKERIATVGANGTASSADIKSGEHTIELRLDGATPKTLQRNFENGAKVSLSGPEVALEKLAVAETVPQPAKTETDETEKPAAAQVTSAPGVLGERVLRGGGFVHYATPKAAGHYSFQAHSRIGGFLKHDKLQWYAGYQDSENYVLFTVDGKHATVREMKNGKSSEINRINFNANSDEWVQVRLAVKPDSIDSSVKLPGGDWSDMGAVTSSGRDFTKDKVGFYIPGNDEVAVSDFNFK